MHAPYDKTYTLKITRKGLLNKEPWASGGPSIRQSHAGRDREFCGGALGLWLAGARDRLAAADPNIDSSGNDPANSALVHNAQVAVAQGEAYGLRSGSSEMDPLKSRESE